MQSTDKKTSHIQSFASAPKWVVGSHTRLLEMASIPNKYPPKIISDKARAPETISKVLRARGCISWMYFLLRVEKRAAMEAEKTPTMMAHPYEMLGLFSWGREMLMKITPTITMRPVRMSFLMKGVFIKMGSKREVKNEAEPRQARVTETEFPILILP